MKTGKWIAGVLAVVTGISLLGCGGPRKVENYPGTEPKETVEKQEDVQAVYDGNKVTYRIGGKGGTLKVNAEIIGDTQLDFPVYTYQNLEMKEADLINVENYLLNRRNTNIILPLEIADAEYVANRIELLTERVNQYEEKGLELPPCVSAELEELNRLQKEDSFESRYTMADPGRVCFLSLKDYYKQEYNVDADTEFSFSEALTEDGELVRFDVIKNNGNLYVHLYRVNALMNQPPEYELAARETDLPVKFDQLDAKVCEASAKDILSRVGFEQFDCIGTYPIYEYGTKDSAEKPLYEQPGYCCFFGANVQGRLRLCTALSDFYSGSSVLTSPTLNSANICTKLASGEPELLDPDFTTTAYDCISVCVDAEGLVDVYLVNPTGYGETKTLKAQLMDFKDVDGKAQKYFEKYMEQSAAKDIEIDRIELGICRTVEEDHFTAVPAWYYFSADSGESPLPMPVAAVNAMDGTIIDIAHGGQTIEY